MTEPTTEHPVEHGEADAAAESATTRLDHRFEVLEAILLAVAAVLTAWTAFQATKWGGVQADSYSRAGAARTESVRASTRAGQLTSVDVDSFTAWVAAVAAAERDERDSGLTEDGSYEPPEGSESEFLFDRLRPEFRTAVDAWLATRPFADPTAPPTPFAMPEYQLADAAQSAELERQADGFAAAGREANQRGDNYVLMTIMFALVIVLVGIGTKMETLSARAFLFGLASVTLVVAAVVVFTFPVEI